MGLADSHWRGTQSIGGYFSWSLEEGPLGPSASLPAHTAVDSATKDLEMINRGHLRQIRVRRSGTYTSQEG